MIPTTSHASSFFDSIENSRDPVGAIKALVPGTEETEWLDFKGGLDQNPKNHTDTPISENDLKKYWSEALAGFGNTGGGVLIWGVDARRNQISGKDEAGGFSLVKDPQGMASRLNQLQVGATEPPLQGVRTKAYDDPAKPGFGFVVCFVPESRWRPHRAEMAGKRFVIRANTSFVDTPLSVLRSMFFPQTRPIVVPEIKPVRSGYEVKALRLSLHNRGTATANDVMLYVSVRPGPRRACPGANVFHSKTEPEYDAMVSVPIHPGVAHEVMVFEFDTPLEDAALSFRIYGDDMEPVESSVSFSEMELSDSVVKTGVLKSLSFPP